MMIFSGTTFDTVEWLIAAAVCVYIAATLIILVYIYAAARTFRADAHARAIDMLERLSRFGRIVPVLPRGIAQHTLVRWNLEERRYEAAFELANRLQASTSLASMRADLARMRSECLIGMGRDGEAEKEIEAAQTALVGARRDRHTLFAQAQVYARLNRKAEAYALYKEVLALTPASLHYEREKILGFLASNAPLAGHSDEMLSWSTQLLAVTKDSNFRIIGYRMASLGASHAGDMDASERYCREAVSAATAAKRAKDAAQATATLALILARRLQFDEALSLVDQAIALDPANTRTGLHSKAEICIALGRFQDALNIAEQARAVAPEYIPSGERYMSALMRLVEARAYLMLRDARNAQRLIDEAEKTLTDAKMSLTCRATSLCIAALNRDRARFGALLSDVMAALSDFPNENNLRKACLINACRSAAELGEWAICEAQANYYLELSLNPADYAAPYYYLGQCARAADDLPKAKEYFTRAAQVHPDLYYSRLAQEALE